MLRRWLPPALGLPDCVFIMYLVAITTESRRSPTNCPNRRSALPLVWPLAVTMKLPPRSRWRSKMRRDSLASAPQPPTVGAEGRHGRDAAGRATWLVTFAAPAYLKGRRVPEAPEELREHRCMNVRFFGSGGLYRWEYAQDGRAFDVEITWPLISNDLDILVSAARGRGCRFIMQQRIKAALAPRSRRP